MVVLILPVGSAHGWGNCGRGLTRELALRGDVHLIPSRPLRPDNFSSEIEFAFFASLTGRLRELTGPQENWPDRVDHPVIAGVGLSDDFLPYWKKPLGKPTVGYTFIEYGSIRPEALENARRHFDCILTGSSWCTETLKRHGIPTGTVLQGIDPETFSPRPQHRKMLRDHFVVFSGGKFEFRKGQDLVIRAFKVLSERHRDVVLIAAWHNYSQKADVSMIGTKYLTLPPPPAEEERADYRFFVHRLLQANGVDVNRVILIPRRQQETMVSVYHETDIGLFPSRCESGTNLVLMEYMACGKPVIASWVGGHRDIVTDENALIVRSSTPVHYQEAQSPNPPYDWDDPSLDELIEKLEWAYQNRDAVRPLGDRAATDMSQRTWARMAEDVESRLCGRRPLCD